MVDDDTEILRQARESFKQLEPPPMVTEEQEFSKALAHIKGEGCDLVVLDIRAGGADAGEKDTNAGNRVAEQIRKDRFVPIVFYTALPENAEHVDGPFVDVVAKKSGGMTELLKAVRKMLGTGVPEAKRAIEEHVAEVQRSFLWDFAENDWESLSEKMNEVDIAYLLSRRLAASLTVSGIAGIKSELRQLTSDGDHELAAAHPHFYYVMPPIEKNLRFGDILRSEDGSYSVVLTPTCDLVESDSRPVKACHVLLGRADEIKQTPEYVAAKKSDASNTQKSAFKLLLKNRGRQQDQCFFLPPAQSLPGLVLDLQDVYTVKHAAAKKIDRPASLDSPFAEMLVAQLARYYGRIGAPDLEVDKLAKSILA